MGRFVYAIIVERPDFDVELRRAFGQLAEQIRRRDGDIAHITLILESLTDSDPRVVKIKLVDP